MTPGRAASAVASAVASFTFDKGARLAPLRACFVEAAEAPVAASMATAIKQISLRMILSRKARRPSGMEIDDFAFAHHQAKIRNCQLVSSTDPLLSMS